MGFDQMSLRLFIVTNLCHKLTFFLYRQVKGNNTNEKEMIACTAWEYDLSKFSQTLASEFNLVCDRENLLSIGIAGFDVPSTPALLSEGCTGQSFED